MLRVRSLHKRYGDLEVLGGIDFELRRREVLALLGPSGCGKSTLFRVLLGLEDHNAGAIVSHFDSAGYLPQGGLLFSWKTVRENVELPLAIQGIDQRTRRKVVDEQLEPFGLRGFDSRYPQELSGGMRQRAALLRTVVTGAPILFLDEPFGALDTITRHRLQDWLAALIQELDRTMLLVTHDLEEALVLSERVIVLTQRPASVAGEILFKPEDAEEKQRTSKAFRDAKATLLETIEKGAHKTDDQNRCI